MGFLSSATKLAMRLFMPDLHHQMEQEGLLEGDLLKSGAAEDPNFVQVVDNGADVTIFAFSGLDILYTGLARFEFRSSLKRVGVHANYVFLRDNLRSGFNLRPDGKKGGAAFYEEVIREVMAQLGSSHNIALGSSIGGASAIYFGSRCGMDHCIVFGATMTPEGYTKFSVVSRSLLNVWTLLRDPRGYIEVALVMLSAVWARHRLMHTFGLDGWADPFDAFSNAPRRPLLTAYYGERSYPDARHARMLAEFPETTVHGLPTGRHNTPAFLKSKGKLSDALGSAVLAGLAACPVLPPQPAVADA